MDEKKIRLTDRQTRRQLDGQLDKQIDKRNKKIIAPDLLGLYN